MTVVQTAPAPLYDPHAQTSLLGAMLLSRQAIIDALDLCGPDDLHGPAQAEAFAAIKALYERGEPVDTVTVHDEMRRRGVDYVPIADLSQWVTDTPASGNAATYASIVRRHSVLRQADAIGLEVRIAAAGSDISLLSSLQEQLAALTASQPGTLETRAQRRGKIDWPAFWSHDRSAQDWVAEPFLVRGRSHAVYASAKEGKSDFMLPVAAALATGQPVLRQAAGEPTNVGYFDFEMTEDDLQQRLLELGCDETCDLSHFHYYLLPTIPPLDTAAGGAEMEAIIADDNLDVVVIDTTSRAVWGDEDKADTIRSYYTHTGIVLKRAGVTSVRLDHAGKDPTRGQRGTSAKNDDVDIVYHLTRTETGTNLHATHRRIGWVPEKMDYEQLLDPVVRYVPAATSWPAGTSDAATLLDKYNVPLDASVREAAAILKQNGDGRRPGIVSAGLKWRRERIKEDGRR